MKPRFEPIFFFALSALTAGCGLDDYERLMVRSQANAKNFDDANALLGEPLELPKIVEAHGEKQTERDAPVFIRPPLGIGRKPDETSIGGLIQHYSPLAATPRTPGSAAGLFSGVFAAVATDRKDFKEFCAEVLRNWGQDAANLKPRQGKTPAGAATIETMDFDDANAGFSAFFLRGDTTTMVCVIYRFEKDKRDSVRRAIDASVDWIGLDAQALELRSKFARATRKPKSAAPAPASTPIQSPPAPKQ